MHIALIASYAGYTYDFVVHKTWIRNYAGRDDRLA